MQETVAFAPFFMYQVIFNRGIKQREKNYGMDTAACFMSGSGQGIQSHTEAMAMALR